MSDLEKVFAYANEFCATRVLQLRWEGAGDCSHPAALLGELKDRTYNSSVNKIKFHAVLNLYEAVDSEIADTAYESIVQALAGATDEQTFGMWGGVDVTRGSRTITGQPIADLMFVRNIMLTSDGTDSQTKASTDLKNLHVATVRNRSGSIGDGGQLKIGMSGAPGLIGASNSVRSKTEIQKLFIGANDMFRQAKRSGMIYPNRKAWGLRDMDNSVEVMKNDGTSLGNKPTYYLTFMG
jgi:hypothetical protein